MDAPFIADIRDAFGAAFVGLFVSTALWGVTISQTWLYFWKYHNRDPRKLQFLIAFITAMDALHTIFSAYAIYWFLIVNFGEIEHLTANIWAMNAQTFLTIIIGASVELYYARQVYKVSQSIICPIIIAVLVTCSYCIGFYFAIQMVTLNRGFSISHRFKWVSCAGMILGVLGELLITVSLCWSLYRKRTGFARTDSIITILMAYAINSGLLSCGFSVAVVVRFTISPSSLIWLSLVWVMIKCQVNSLLALLNSRDYINERPTTNAELNADTAYNLSSIPIEPKSVAYRSTPREPVVSVTVHRSTTSNYGLGKSDHDNEAILNTQKPDASTIFHSQ